MNKEMYSFQSFSRDELSLFLYCRMVLLYVFCIPCNVKTVKYHKDERDGYCHLDIQDCLLIVIQMALAATYLQHQTKQ